MNLLALTPKPVPIRSSALRVSKAMDMVEQVVNQAAELLEQAKPINVDFVDSAMGSGFSISSQLSTGATCGTSCSTC